MASKSLAILIGAGASYGAWQRGVLRPPLGDALFAALEDRFPETWGNLNARQREAFTESDSGLGFEHGMQAIWDQEMQGLPTAVPVQSLLTDMAVYFAEFRPPADGDDCYSKLIGCLRDRDLIGERLAVASLNYEVLFDLAAVGVGVGVSAKPLPPARGGITVWKPHGACNLVPEPVVAGNWQNIGVFRSPNMLVGGKVVAIPPRRVIELYASQRNIPPAMSLYAPGKHSPVAPDYIEEARRQWSEWARRAETVIAIGVRYVPDDGHIWNDVIRGTSDVWYLGDDMSADKLSEQLGGRLVHLGSYFRESLPDLVSRIQHLM